MTWVGPTAIIICRVADCPHPKAADAYIRLLTTSEQARQAFRKHGFGLPGSAATQGASK